MYTQFRLQPCPQMLFQGRNTHGHAKGTRDAVWGDRPVSWEGFHRGECPHEYSRYVRVKLFARRFPPRIRVLWSNSQGFRRTTRVSRPEVCCMVWYASFSRGNYRRFIVLSGASSLPRPSFSCSEPFSAPDCLACMCTQQVTMCMLLPITWESQWR